MKKAILAIVVFVVVVVGGYNVLDASRRRSANQPNLVNAPTFKALPPMWDERLATEGKLTKDERDAIGARFNSAGLERFQSRVNRVSIAYKQFLADPVAEKGAVVISSGRTESMLIYRELIRDLNAHGYSVYIHDHRGQGLSGRLLDDPHKSYVEHFDDYVADMKQFVDLIRPRAKHRKVYLLAHSMGGGIASLYVEQHPGDFDAAALVTPMHAPEMPSFAVPGAQVMSVISPRGYALGQDEYHPRPFSATQADLVHSRTRFEWINEIYAAADKDAPRIGGPTHTWLNEASHAAKRAVMNAGKIDIPVMILQASDDSAVNNAAQGEFCKNMRPGLCKGYLLEKSFHAVFNEADTYRVPALTAILQFFDTGKFPA